MKEASLFVQASFFVGFPKRCLVSLGFLPNQNLFYNRRVCDGKDYNRRGVHPQERFF